MKPLGLSLATLILAAYLAAGAPARAAATTTSQLVLATNDFAAPALASPNPAPGRTLEWDPRKGRWGLKLGVDPRIDRETDLRDLAPGVFYKLSPRLHIGGDVTLAPDTGIGYPNHLVDPQAPNPRVRLETTFKF
jgi:hypothetical protein